MTEIVLRVRLVGGDQLDVVYDGPDDVEANIAAAAIAILGKDDGVLRCKHGDRLIALYSRGVATVEVAPRGAIL